MHNFKQLSVWKKAIELVTKIFRILKKFPRNETYGIISQISRSATSIPCNIAEGAGRHSQKEFHQFLAISSGSAFELETLLIVSRNIGYLSDQDFDELMPSLLEIQKMIFSLQQHQRTKPNP